MQAELAPERRQQWRSLLSALPTRRRRQTAALILGSSVCALLEWAVLLLTLPLLTRLGANAHPPLPQVPRLESQNTGLLEAISTWPLADIALTFAATALLATALRTALQLLGQRLGMALASDLGRSVYLRVLHQPYAFHVQHPSSELLSRMSSTVTVALGVLQPMVLGTAALIQGAALLAALLWLHPWPTLVLLLGMTTLYGTMGLFSRAPLQTQGLRHLRAEQARYQILQESLGGIRDVLLEHQQAFFCKQWLAQDLAMRQAEWTSTVWRNMPRALVEMLTLALIAALACWAAWGNASSAPHLATLGVLALGCLRILPHGQQLYQSWSTWMSCRAAMAQTLQALDWPLPPARPATTSPLDLGTGLTLQGLGFTHTACTQPVFHDLNLHIAKGQHVGLCGPSGGGKSTLLDVLMGLLPPSQGCVKVNGQQLQEAHTSAWQASIAHVPQQVFLADQTIAQNIAFGLPTESIDPAQVRKAARLAQLEEFIAKLPAGLDTLVGERGIRLSGGQRQRIGLARAFYKNAQVLLLDEATSALDEATQTRVLAEIRALGPELTVLMVAHRRSSLRGCDHIYRLENGQLSGPLSPEP